MKITNEGRAQIILGGDATLPEGSDPPLDCCDVISDPVDRALEDNGAYAEYPFIPAATSLIQSEENANSNVDATIAVTLGATPTEGNLEIAVLTMRDVGSTGTLAGWTWLDTFSSDIGNGGTGTAWYRVVPAGASATVTVTKIGSHGAGLWVGEFSAGAFIDHVTVDTVAASTNLTVGTLEVGSNDSLLVSAFVQAATGAVFTPTGGATEVEQGGMVGGVGPSWLGQYEVAASGAGQSGTASSDTNQDYGGILILFAPAGSLAWVPAPNVIDDDAATYHEIDGTDVLRIDLGAPFLIDHSHLRIATETAGSRTYTISGATLADFSDAVALGTFVFTATGSFTAQDLTTSWTPTAEYQFYQLTGDDETRRIHTWALFEASLGGNVAAHLADTEDAHDASAISIVDTGTYFAGDDVEAALQEIGAGLAVGFVTKVDGGLETLDAHGTAGATETLDLASGNWHSLTLDADCTVTVTGFTAAAGCSALVKVTQDGTGGWAITWDADIVWAGDDQPAQGAGDVSWFVLASDEGDSTIYGFPVGGTSVTYATPAIVLGTAAADGAADTVIRSDATIVAFDDVDPSTAAFDDVADPGVAAFAARSDHVHGMPSVPAGNGGIGPLLLSSDHATPIVFDDILQASDGSDFLYASEP